MYIYQKWTLRKLENIRHAHRYLIFNNKIVFDEKDQTDSWFQVEIWEAYTEEGPSGKYYCVT